MHAQSILKTYKLRGDEVLINIDRDDCEVSTSETWAERVVSKVITLKQFENLAFWNSGQRVKLF